MIKLTNILRSGRKMSMMFGSLLFTLGAVFMAVSDSKETLLVGRCKL